MEICVNGRVQGVGFRPFVFSLAVKLSLKGSVENGPEGVRILVYGERKQIECFLSLLEVSAPESSAVETVTSKIIDIKSTPNKFFIKDSEVAGMFTTVPPDTAICSACVHDLEDVDNRRFAYPFTHCSQCGPRFSIINTMPFDRANTSMASFLMCGECFSEYENPESRRFHNQTNCCAQCGPKVWLEDSSGCIVPIEKSGSILDRAADIIQSGGILALKGMGGFNLLCDASNPSAIERLRIRKVRPAKSFALMAKNVEMVEQFSQPSLQEIAWLKNSISPIVLIKRKNNDLPENCAPNLSSLGFVLPHTALHILLMQRLNAPVVFTSGNRSGLPQSYQNSKARNALSEIADFYLMHDREIVQPLDDSVVQLLGESAQIIRAGRGLIPMHLKIPEGLSCSENAIAMGSQVKNTITLMDKSKIVLSSPLDSLSNMDSLLAYEERNTRLKALYQFTPNKVVVDKHVHYQLTNYGEGLAEQEGIPIHRVQHHHAHLAACLLENNHPHNGETVLGVCFDGTGFGGNNELWGAEFFLFDYQHCERFASFQTIPLLGASLAIKEPWRCAYAHLRTLGDWEFIAERYQNLELVDFLKTKPVQVLDRMALKNINSPLASSAGRLFDAVAAVLNICRNEISYEGQAAMELQALAESAIFEKLPSPYPFEIKQH
ncbi:MAG: carbamoyltransferase HypF, partial [Pseudomonadales bacterium]|nr:carbamoyltransferase HypF [Pseudomonadales bacterium]